jgi:hypothetical protein
MSNGTGFTLRLVFEGICAFVPDTPFFYRDGQGKPQAGEPSSLAVLLPDVRSADIADWETYPAPMVTNPCYRASHAPLLSLNPGNVAGSDGMLVDGFFNDPLTGEMRVLHVLDHEAMTFATDGSKWPRLSFESTIPDPDTQPLPGTCPQLRRSLWWLPRLSEISPPHQYCDKRLLTASPREFPALGLACRIDIPGGHLSIAAFNKDGTQSWNYTSVTRKADGTLEFPPPEKWVWLKAIGNEIRCEIEIADTEVVLNLEDPDAGDGDKASATLRPAAGGKVVEVRIANAELDAVVLRPESLPPATPLPDADFQAFYPFTTGKETKPWPAPIFSSESDRPGFVLKPCSGAAFSGSREAAAAEEAKT